MYKMYRETLSLRKHKTLRLFSIGTKDADPFRKQCFTESFYNDALFIFSARVSRPLHLAFRIVKSKGGWIDRSVL